MRLEQFDMERLQSTYENQVDYNLSESGVRPLTPRELLGSDADALLDQPLVYTQSNGTRELRELIASLYPGAGADHVEVTNGGAEANFVSLFRLVDPGDEVALLVPTYMQTWGLARAFGATVKEWRLIDDPRGGRWRPDLDELKKIVTPRTKLIIICTPNNPTGARLTADELDAIARLADKNGSWILSDEIYRGAEVDGVEAPSMWGRHPRVLVTSGLSKAYGLPGLRIGWVVGPPDVVASLWSYHDYITIAPGALSDRLARVALDPDKRLQLLARTREIIRTNLPLVEKWLHDRHPGFAWTSPEAGAILYVRYNHRLRSTKLVTRLREEHSVLIVPGDHFGMDGYLRIGFGESAEYITAGLGRLHALLESLPVAERLVVPSGESH
jgi:aspartate/methionine/tyrosine aminotransferase